MAKPKSPKVGLWMIGACGGVGSTVAFGLAALRRGLATNTGLVTALPPLRDVPLCDTRSIIIGGHEIRRGTFLESVRNLHERSNVFRDDLIRKCAADLRTAQRNVRPGTLLGAGNVIRGLADRSDFPRERTTLVAVERIADDIRAFRDANRLDHVVVVNLASSEPPAKLPARMRTYASLRKAMSKPGETPLPTSCLYALAAFEAGSAYVNFTPSTGIRPGAIRERGDELGLPYMGSDGKTGETLVKSVLAPMFAMRNLNVLSWAGQNILGNRDGQVLRDPKTRASKIATKDGVISRIVGGNPATRVSIDYVPSLDDWKIAWDFIHFQGFLDTKMSLQFVWQGCDSLLAAPLVIDLARLAAHELEHKRPGSPRFGEPGPPGAMRHLGFFFKDPLDVREHDLFSQWQGLVEHLTRRTTEC